MDQRGWRSGLVVLFEPLANFARLYTDNGVITSCVVGRPVIKEGSNRALFQMRFIAVQTVPHDIIEELLAALACVKKWAGEDQLQFTKDCALIGHRTFGRLSVVPSSTGQHSAVKVRLLRITIHCANQDSVESSCRSSQRFEHPRHIRILRVADPSWPVF
jgi:hypothetical protein